VNLAHGIRGGWSVVSVTDLRPLRKGGSKAAVTASRIIVAYSL